MGFFPFRKNNPSSIRPPKKQKSSNLQIQKIRVFEKKNSNSSNCNLKFFDTTKITNLQMTNADSLPPLPLVSFLKDGTHICAQESLVQWRRGEAVLTTFQLPNEKTEVLKLCTWNDARGRPTLVLQTPAELLLCRQENGAWAFCAGKFVLPSSAGSLQSLVWDLTLGVENTSQILLNMSCTVYPFFSVLKHWCLFDFDDPSLQLETFLESSEYYYHDLLHYRRPSCCYFARRSIGDPTTLLRVDLTVRDGRVVLPHVQTRTSGQALPLLLEKRALKMALNGSKLFCVGERSCDVGDLEAFFAGNKQVSLFVLGGSFPLSPNALFPQKPVEIFVPLSCGSVATVQGRFVAVILSPSGVLLDSIQVSFCIRDIRQNPTDESLLLLGIKSFCVWKTT